MNITERIATIIKVNQLSAATFADKLGVQRSNVSHLLNGRNKPSMDFIEKVLEHFPRVDAGWLLTGKSTQIVGEQHAQETNAEPKISKTPLSISHPKGRTVERIVVFYTDRTFDVYESQST
jgi:transcriptional regulator with XRE-family HTH domain